MASIKGRYARIEIPLDKAESGKELFITGDYLSIISITGEGTCGVKLDHRHSQTIDFREISGISGAFERLYFTTDGAGGMCSIFVGTGMAIHISVDPQKLLTGSPTSTQIETTTTTVQRMASAPLKLTNVVILNSNASYYAVVGPYVSALGTFKSYGYVLYPKQTLEFDVLEMYSMACTSGDGSNNVYLNIIGTYE